MTEDEMVGWHHHLNGHEFEQALGVDDGQGGLVCCMQSMGLGSSVPFFYAVYIFIYTH